MIGLRYDFEREDLVLNANGGFTASLIDNQNCALVSLSQICRLTEPQQGEQIGSKLENVKQRNVGPILATAKRAVERDGGKNVSITLDDKQRLQFKANYGND